MRKKGGEGSQQLLQQRQHLETTLQLPEDAREPAADSYDSSPEVLLAAEAGLPEGWMEVRDTSSGHMYYVHAQTRHTQWERPRAAVPTT